MQRVNESANQQLQGSFRVLIAGGGTGGHVIPALAIGRELRDRYDAELLFVGTARGLETRLVPEAGFPLELVESGMLKGVSLATRLKTMTDLPRGVSRCIGILRRFKPNAVVGVGGYASGPAMIAAKLVGTPMLAYEPNAVPGLANRIVGRFVAAAAVNFEQTCSFFRNAVVTGVPVRKEFFSLVPKTAETPPHLLIFGGSQGARGLNQAMPAIVSQLLEAIPGLTILHQAGARHVESTQAAYAQSGTDVSRWQVSAFLDDMPQRFAAADLILCRSGSSVAELAAAGKPSLLVPFPLAADDHQRKNAEIFAEAGAAEMLLESEMTPEVLYERLVKLFTNPEGLERMSAKARSLAHPDALEKIASLVKEIGLRQ